MTDRLPRVRRAGEAKPRVLLVDDHPAVLHRASAMLADSFDVVDVAAGGREAIQSARRLDPDAIVLDINMPGFDGFETMRALERAGSRAAVVFLSLLADADHVSEAFRLGGRAYVVKPRMLSDLAVALDQVLVGRRFVPSLPLLFQITASSGHALHLYSDDQSFADSIATYFDLALRRGDATCLIATESIRDRVSTQLRARGWDVDASAGVSRYRAIDTHAALVEIMRDGVLDATRLAEVVEGLDHYRRTVSGGAAPRLIIAGNLSSTLSGYGDATGGLAIEQSWKALTQDRAFLTVCGYSASCFGDHASDWSTTASQHADVCHSSDI